MCVRSPATANNTEAASTTRARRSAARRLRSAESYVLLLTAWSDTRILLIRYTKLYLIHAESSRGDLKGRGNMSAEFLRRASPADVVRSLHRAAADHDVEGIVVPLRSRLRFGGSDPAGSRLPRSGPGPPELGWAPRRNAGPRTGRSASRDRRTRRCGSRSSSADIGATGAEQVLRGVMIVRLDRRRDRIRHVLPRASRPRRTRRGCGSPSDRRWGRRHDPRRRWNRAPRGDWWWKVLLRGKRCAFSRATPRRLCHRCHTR